jgi:hypothetical protein
MFPNARQGKRERAVIERAGLFFGDGGQPRRISFFAHGPITPVAETLAGVAELADAPDSKAKT